MSLRTLNLSNMEVETITTAPETTKKVQNEPIPRGKHWAGCTLNNPTAADEACWLAKIAPIADYYVYGNEISKSGTPHFQFMVCFKTMKRLTQVIKLFPTKAHWETKSPMSTMKEASDYCKKVGNFDLYLFVYINSYRMVSLLNMVNSL